MSVTVVDKIVGNLIECAHGDGVSTAFMPDIIAPLPTANTTYYRTDWQGTYPLTTTSRTNLVIRSREFNSTAWNKTSFPVTALADQAMAPDGSTSADSVVQVASTDNHAILTTATIAITSGQDYRLQFFVKPIGAQRYIGVNGDIGAGKLGLAVGFDLTLGTVTTGAGATITPLPDGWFFITLTKASTGIAAQPCVILRNTSGSGLESFAGNASNGVYLWEMQLQLASEGGAVITTGATAVTVTDYTLSSGLVTLATPLSSGQALYRKLFNEYGIVL